VFVFESISLVHKSILSMLSSSPFWYFHW